MNCLKDGNRRVNIGGSDDRRRSSIIIVMVQFSIELQGEFTVDCFSEMRLMRRSKITQAGRIVLEQISDGKDIQVRGKECAE